MNRENFVGILLYSVIPMVICAFCFVYGLTCCVKFHMEGQTNTAKCFCWRAAVWRCYCFCQTLGL